MKEKQQIKKIQKKKSAEEQGEEIEALQSIFQEDFEELYAGQGEVTHKFAITIDASGDKRDNPASVKLEIAFGPLYPKLPPTINVVKLKGLSDVHYTLTFSPIPLFFIISLISTLTRIKFTHFIHKRKF